MWHKGCGWTQARLPLIAGGELIGPERRWVERHLIGCAKCRHHLVSLHEALEVLQTASEDAAILEAASLPSAASLWPALERQIREARRPWPKASPWAPIATGLAACGLFALALVFWRSGAPVQKTETLPSPVRPQAAAPAPLPAKLVESPPKPAPKPVDVVSSPRPAPKKGKPPAPPAESSVVSRSSSESDRGSSSSGDSGLTK
jgi:hypothetical protein